MGWVYWLRDVRWQVDAGQLFGAAALVFFAVALGSAAWGRRR